MNEFTPEHCVRFLQTAALIGLDDPQARQNIDNAAQIVLNTLCAKSDARDCRRCGGPIPIYPDRCIECGMSVSFGDGGMHVANVPEVHEFIRRCAATRRDPEQVQSDATALLARIDGEPDG